MISKNDTILLLTHLSNDGVDIGSMVMDTLSSTTVPIEVLKFINEQRPIELTQFYEKLRKSYNEKKSKLYITMVKDDVDPREAITTLASYQLQALLYAKQVDDDQMFLRNARLREVGVALSRYYKDYDLTTCMEVLRLLRADLLACENITGRRDDPE